MNLIKNNHKMRGYVPRKKDYSVDKLKEAIEKVKNRGKDIFFYKLQLSEI